MSFLVGHNGDTVAGHVDVRTQSQCFSPVAHRAVGIEPLRRFEGAYGLGVVEREVDDQPLVEIALGIDIDRRDLVAVIAHTVE